MFLKVFLSLLLACSAFANDVFWLNVYHTGFSFVTGQSTNIQDNTLVRVDLSHIDFGFIDKPNTPPNSGILYLNTYYVYKLEGGEKHLITDSTYPIKALFFQVVRKANNPQIMLFPDPHDIYTAAWPIDISPKGVSSFVVEKINPIWTTNCVLETNDFGQEVWWACLNHALTTTQELCMVSYPWMELGIPAGFHALEVTENLTDWFFVEQINGPAIKILYIDPRVPHRFFRARRI